MIQRGCFDVFRNVNVHGQSKNTDDFAQDKRQFNKQRGNKYVFKVLYILRQMK